jgi:hypothetical protein
VVWCCCQKNFRLSHTSRQLNTPPVMDRVEFFTSMFTRCKENQQIIMNELFQLKNFTKDNKVFSGKLFICLKCSGCTPRSLEMFVSQKGLLKHLHDQHIRSSVISSQSSNLDNICFDASQLIDKQLWEEQYRQLVTMKELAKKKKKQQQQQQQRQQLQLQLQQQLVTTTKTTAKTTTTTEDSKKIIKKKIIFGHCCKV